MSIDDSQELSYTAHTSSASFRTVGTPLQQQQLYASSNEHNTAPSNHDAPNILLSSSSEQTVTDKICTYILNSLITFIYKMYANFTSPDEEISRFRNVVIIQCGVVCYTTGKSPFI